MSEKTKIGLKLRELREQKQLNAKDVASLLHDKYDIEINFKALYSYETGRTFPNTDIFLALCHLYECNDILYTFGYVDKPNAFAISPEDLEVIKKYHALPSSGQNMILGALGIDKTKQNNQKIS